MSTIAFEKILSAITICGQAFALFLLCLAGTSIIRKKVYSIQRWIGEHGVIIAGCIALFATLGSLYLSEIAKLPPCKLCWLQRICMYPQVLILFLAVSNRKHQPSAAIYGLLLSLFGLMIAAYHYAIQIATPRIQFCSITDPTSCTDAPFTFFGYITIPLMAATAFLVIIFLLSMYRLAAAKH